MNIYTPLSSARPESLSNVIAENSGLTTNDSKANLAPSLQPNLLAKQHEESQQQLLLSDPQFESQEALKIREKIDALLVQALGLLSDAHKETPSDDTLDHMAEIEESLKQAIALWKSHIADNVVFEQGGLTRTAAVSNTRSSAELTDAHGLIDDIKNLIKDIPAHAILAYTEVKTELKANAQKESMIKELFAILASGLKPMDETEAENLIGDMRKALKNQKPKMITADLELIVDKKNSAFKDAPGILADRSKHMHERIIRDMLEIPEVPEIPEGVTPSIVFLYFMMIIDKKMNGINDMAEVVMPRLGQFADEQSMAEALARALKGKEDGDEIDYSELIPVHKNSPLRKPGDPEDLKMTLGEMMAASQESDPSFPKLPNSNAFKEAERFKEDLKDRIGVNSAFVNSEEMVHLNKLRQDLNLFQSTAAIIQKEIADVSRKLIV